MIADALRNLKRWTAHFYDQETGEFHHAGAAVDAADLEAVKAPVIPDALRTKLEALPRYAFDQDGSIYGPVDADAGTFIRHEDLDAVLATVQGADPEPPKLDFLL